ncbi:HD-GYP domain-containing protein, partial [Synechococcus sp. R6-6]
RHHHERWDGSGYPDGLKGEEIPLVARIFQIIDIYDALTSERPYKRAFTAQEAIDILREETARGWRDPQLVEYFFEFLRSRALDLE